MPNITDLEIEALGSFCPTCQAELFPGDWPYCPHGTPGGHHHMTPVTVDLGDRIVEISSMQQADKISRDSFDRYNRGENVAPMVFRAFNQDPSNYDRPTIHGKQQYNPHTPIHKPGVKRSNKEPD